jgi:putative ABC transport system permease protein
VLKHYLVNAIRGFWRFRVTALVNLAGLALALVCFVATYLFLDALLRNGDMQFANADRTYVVTEEIWTTQTQRMIPAFPMASPGVARYLRTDLPNLEAVARLMRLGPGGIASADRTIDVYAAAVDPEFLDIFDFRVVDGDLRHALDAGNNVVITEETARRLYGTAHAAGRVLLYQNRTQFSVAAVIGALPAASHMGDDSTSTVRFGMLMPMEAWRTSAGISPDDPMWGSDSFHTYVLLPKDGSVPLSTLRETLRTFASRHLPKGQIILKHDVIPLTHVRLALLDALAGSRTLPLQASAFLLDALILAIACLNYANLSVAIATTRAREIGMRKVLGATQPHLIRQYLVEAGLMGGVALVVVLIGTAVVMPAITRAFGLEFHFSALLRPGLWGLVLLLLAVISLVGGAYPALVLSRVRPVDSLRAGTVRTGPRFVSTLLVGLQFAAASFLLVVALLMATQNEELQRMALRPDRDPVVTIDNNLLGLGIPVETLRSELLRDPRIRSVTGTMDRPWDSGGPHQSFRRSEDALAPTPVTMLNQISYDFFDTVGIRIVAGRDFSRDRGDPAFSWAPPKAADPAPAAIVDISLLHQLGWERPEQAVEQIIYRVSPWDPGAPSQPFHVIGVSDNGYPRLVGPNADSNIYVLSSIGANVPLVRISRTDVPGALAYIDSVWKQIVPKVPVRRQFLDDLFNAAYETYSTVGRVLSGLAALAFVIAVMGLVGMAIHVTGRRRREIGIRKTLGATARGVVLMLLRDFSKPVVIANVIAWPFAFLAGRYYFNLFTQRATMTPWPFLASLLITLGIAWLAVSAQAFRAASVKPANVLHSD